MTAVYPRQPGSRFDAAYYTGSHSVLARKLFGPHGLRDLRVTIAEAGIPDGDPPFWAVSELIFADAASFAAAMQVAGADLMADTPNYTDVTPQLFASRLAILAD